MNRLARWLRHRRRDIRYHREGTIRAACSCGWAAKFEHYPGSRTIERDWADHLKETA